MVSTEMAAALQHGGERGRPSLTVLYDERCDLCRDLKRWLGRQAKVADVNFVAAGGTEARGRYPYLDHARTRRVLTVVDDRGFVYEGERAWLVCAWALPRWQPVVEHMSTSRVGLGVAWLGTRVMNAYRHRRMSDDRCDACPR